MPDNEYLRDLKQREKEIEERERYLKSLLPHLHPIEALGFQWYWWQFQWIFELPVKIYDFLLKPNQTGGSLANIARVVHWATDKSLWFRLWTTTPTQFWYLYPNKGTANREFKEKWEKQILPRGEMKDDPVYGWTANWRGQDIVSLNFNSGVTVYFLTYEMDWANLQASTVYAIFLDEEVPYELFPELNARRRGCNGYLIMNATPTRCQMFWKRELEPQPGYTPRLDKRIILATIYDCLFDIDGNPSRVWTHDRIKVEIASCGSKEEVRRRFFSEFAIETGGLEYHAFRRSKNLVKPYPIPSDWLHTVCLDYGSGDNVDSEKAAGHPGAISFLAVNPTYTKGAIYQGWRGDDVTTTASDIILQYLKMMKEVLPWISYRRVLTQLFYDPACKDLQTVGERIGLTLEHADKSSAKGFSLMNSLFKNCVLDIFDTPELSKMADEMENIKKETPKNKRLDDLSDTGRYQVIAVDWDLSALVPAIEAPQTNVIVLSDRERDAERTIEGDGSLIEDPELAYWDSLYNTYQ